MILKKERDFFMKHKKPVLLVIMDGFGCRDETFYNAVYHARTPNIDTWMDVYPHTRLCAAGECVGLLPGYIGNSEVGHLTIGAGRVIVQPVTIIHRHIEDKTFFENKILRKNLENIKNGLTRLHIMGMLSDAGVHSHIKHLYAFLKAAKEQGVHEVYIHGFLDGRDVSPKSAAKYIEQLSSFIKKEGIGVIASLHGRFYAMDRDKNWGRTRKSYDVLVGKTVDQDCVQTRESWEEILEKSYKNGITDEFLVPVNIQSKGVIKNGDGVIFFNFRADRARQLTQCFVGEDVIFGADEVKRPKLAYFVTPVSYACDLKTDVMYKQSPVKNTLKKILSNSKKSIFTVAETEKYAHVTYFFDGRKEQKLAGETRVLIPSIKARDYVKYPQMSAAKITKSVIESLHKDPKDFYLINYANCDMVGHSGNFEATVKAVECVDTELKKLYDVVISHMDGIMYVTADHGNAEQMFDEDTGQPNTAHTTNPVPFIFIKKDLKGSQMQLKLDQLADVAPFILENMGLQ